MKLLSVLPQIERQLNLPAGLLAGIASDALNQRLFFAMCITLDEEYFAPVWNDLIFLYAMIRALKPLRVLESGTGSGRSAAAILTALEHNEHGSLITVDIDPSATAHIPPDILRIEAVTEDITFYVQRPHAVGYESGFDFIHEDAAHSAHSVHAVYGALPHLMPGGGVIVSHDTATGIGADIMRGIRNAGFAEPPCYQWDESPYGYSVMRYEGLK